MGEMKALVQVATLRQQQAQMEEAAVVQHEKQQQLEAALAESQAQAAAQAMSTRAASEASDARVEQMEQRASLLDQQVMELRALLATTTSERDQLQGAMQGTLEFYQAACQQRNQAISERDSALSQLGQAKAAEKLLQGLVETMAVESAEQRQREVQRAQQEQQQREQLLMPEFPHVPLENEASLAIVEELGRGANGAVKRVESKERAVKHIIVRTTGTRSLACLPPAFPILSPPLLLAAHAPRLCSCSLPSPSCCCSAARTPT